MVWVTYFGFGSGGSSGSDHFAPKYVVGNVLAGDPAVGSGPPFRYIPDPGDGSGIALALTQPNGPGDIWIRPGTYTLAAALPAVPAGVLVRGSGRDTTIIVGLSAGDQGVFALSAGSGLHDMTVQSPAPTGATAGSIAMISCTDSVSLERLTLEMNPSAGSTLLDVVYMTGGAGPPPGSNATDILIRVGGDGTVPGRGLHMEGVPPNPSPFLFARNIQIYGDGGLTVGAFIEDAVFVCSQLLIFEYTDTGLAWTTPSGNGGGSLRVDEGAVQTNVGNALTVGVAIQGSGHVLRSLAIACNNTTGGIGMRLTGPDQASISAVEIDDCLITGFADGIVGGENGITTTSFSSNTISDCLIFVASRGIWLSGPSVTGNQIVDNQVEVSDLVSPPPLGGIIIDDDPQGGASSNTIKGNIVNVNGAGGATVHGIRCASQLSVIEGNIVNLNAGGYCISLEDGAERTTVTGNVCTSDGDSLGCIYQAAAANPVVRCVVNGNSCTSNYSADPVAGIPAAIVLEGRASIASNNTIFTGTPSGDSPGITLTATTNNSNVVGNVCEGSASLAVNDLGALNNVSNNIGV